MPADIGGYVRNAQLRARKHRALDFLTEPVALRADVSRPLYRISVSGQIGSIDVRTVVATVQITHYYRAFSIFVYILNTFEIALRNPLVSVHTRCIPRYIGMYLVEFDRPVSVVPPVIHAHSQKHSKLFVAVSHLFFV